jgi:hypothetical protein
LKEPQDRKPLSSRRIEEEKEMKKLLLGVLIFSCGTALFAQQNTKRIFLSPKSNITTAQVAEGFSKYCPNVVLTQNDAKADYILEAAETVSADEGTTYSHWHFTLMNKDGDVLMTTHPELHFGKKFKHHFEAVCKFVNK